MSQMLWRTLIAVITCLLLYALIPPVLRIIGFEANADLLTVLRIVIGGLALLYILKGPPVPHNL